MLFTAAASTNKNISFMEHLIFTDSYCLFYVLDFIEVELSCFKCDIVCS